MASRCGIVTCARTSIFGAVKGEGLAMKADGSLRPAADGGATGSLHRNAARSAVTAIRPATTRK
jgi:hypothetical protein